MKSLLSFAFLFLVIGCGVKEKPSGQPPSTVVSAPEGFFVTQNKLFLVKPSSIDLVPHEENTVTYRFVKNDLTAVNVRDYQFKIKSNMPTMPEMGGPWEAANVKVTEDGQVSATYDIYHGHTKHLWEFTIEILQDEKVVDRLVYSHLVKEE